MRYDVLDLKDYGVESNTEILWKGKKEIMRNHSTGWLGISCGVVGTFGWNEKVRVI